MQNTSANIHRHKANIKAHTANLTTLLVSFHAVMWILIRFL